MKKAKKILIAGFGDIGKRVARRLHTFHYFQVTALIRKTGASARDPALTRPPGVKFVQGDLSRSRSLGKLSGLADTILHFAPPPAAKISDSHTAHLLAALGPGHVRFHRSSRLDPLARAPMLPRRIVYISTTGVYGNCNGEWIDETRPLKPESARAARRVDAEQQLRKWGRRHRVAITVLRAPGIYAADRLPVERLRRRTPVLIKEDDVFTNHIHADDLAAAVISAMRQKWPKRFRVFNVVDESHLRMGDYFDQVADAVGLPRPPRISRMEAAEKIAPTLLSFMRESRRICNSRLKRELKVVLRYPTLASALSEVRTKAGSVPD
jgi:nucleoside-diphosphate-sugar epimerase